MESLSERYHRETGLHSHYIRNYKLKGIPKKELAFTRKYVWYLETIIKDASNCIVCAAITNPMEAVENTYQILNGGEPNEGKHHNDSCRNTGI